MKGRKGIKIYICMIVFLFIGIGVTLFGAWYPRVKAEKYINMDCEIVETADIACKDNKLVSEVIVEKKKKEDGTMDLKTFLKCCKPEEKRICITKDECMTIDEFRELRNMRFRLNDVYELAKKSFAVATSAATTAAQAKASVAASAGGGAAAGGNKNV